MLKIKLKFKLQPYLFLNWLSFHIILLLYYIETAIWAQCPQLESPCSCAPSIYEPISIICKKAGSLEIALDALRFAKDMPVRKFFFVEYYFDKNFQSLSLNFS